MRNLSFFQLSVANYSRCERWHPKGISSWSLSDWATATVGEVGEACNIIKKMNRLRDGLVGNQGDDADVDVLKSKLGYELADAVIYLDLMAQAAGLSLEDCVRDKFNIVSIRNHFPERL
jgi:NTP pyrophosphatase (non-canonical NTP hydrolase)